MPGAYHTEVVKDAENAFKTYLLDIKFENPMTIGSYVKGFIRAGNRKHAVECIPKQDHFLCAVKTGAIKESGELVLETKRQSSTGKEVSYPFPLSQVGAKSK